MEFSEQFPIVVQALNAGFLQTLKLFFVTLLGAVPLGLIISFGTMSRFKPLSYLMKIIVWIVRGTPLMIQLLIIYFMPGLMGNNIWGGSARTFLPGNAAAASLITVSAPPWEQLLKTTIPPGVSNTRLCS